MTNVMMDPIFFTPDQDAKRPRRLHGGGRGGGDPSAYARQQDALRQQNLAKLRRELGYEFDASKTGGQSSTVGTVNTATADARYGRRRTNDVPNPEYMGGSDAERQHMENKRAARESGYDKIYDDVIGFHAPEMERRATKSEREMKFALARQGQLGGSLEADARGEFGEERRRSLVDLESVGTSARNAAERGGLSALASAESAINQGSDAEGAIGRATSELANSQQAALEQAKAASVGYGLGDLANVYTARSFGEGVNQANKQSVKKPGQNNAPSVGGSGQSSK